HACSEFGLDDAVALGVLWRDAGDQARRGMRQHVGRRLAVEHDGFADGFEIHRRPDGGELRRPVASRIRAEGLVVVPQEGVHVLGFSIDMIRVDHGPGHESGSIRRYAAIAPIADRYNRTLANQGDRMSLATSDFPDERLIWIDLEMTGLDCDRDSILEIATVVTDEDLHSPATSTDF